MRDSPPLHATPLIATLERLATAAGEVGLDLSAHVGRPEGPGWTRTEELAADRALLEDVLERIELGCGAENRPYAGTGLLRSYLWRILTTSVATFLLERRLPDLRAENVTLRFGDSGFAEGLAFASPRFFTLPDDPEAKHPNARVLTSEKDLLGRMREDIATAHLRTLIPTLRELRVRRGTRALWGIGADVCAEAFMFMGRNLDLEQEALDFAEKLLAGPSPLSGQSNFFILEHGGNGKTIRVRNICCLYYKLGNGPCLTCPRLTKEERVAKLAAT